MIAMPSIAQSRVMVSIVILCSTIPAWAADDKVFASERERFRVVTLVRGLDHPWGLAFLPNDDMLVSERPGQIGRAHV